MNAAFLLVTTAWMAGDTAAAAPAPAAADCGACSSCATDACGCQGHKLLGKLQGVFKRKDSCGSCDTCSAPKCHTPRIHREHKCAPACDTCDNCGRGGPKLLEKLRGAFHHDRGCGCDNGCGAGCADGACGGSTVMPRAGEPIPTPPKKMPNKGKRVQTETAPIDAPVSPTLEVAPNASQVPPAIVPSVESDNLRSPF